MDYLAYFFAAPAVQLATGGAFGGLARWLFLRVNVWDGLSAVLLGAILGFYVSPQIAPWAMDTLAGLNFKVDMEKLPAFVAFATGVGGVGLVGLGIDWFNLRIKHLKGDAQ